MRSIVAFAIVISTLTGCDYLPTAENTAKKAVKDSLFDPDSAKFTDVFKGTGDNNYCGWVNAKNRFGAFVGSTPFFYEGMSSGIGFAHLVPEPLRDSDFKRLVEPGTFDKERFISQFGKIRDGCEAAANWERVCGVSSPRETHRLCEGIGEKNYTSRLYKEFYSNNE